MYTYERQKLVVKTPTKIMCMIHMCSIVGTREGTTLQR